MSQFMVGSKHRQTGEVCFAACPKIHTCYKDACDEAKRLAGRMPHKKFFVVQVKEVFQSVEVEKTIL